MTKSLTLDNYACPHPLTALGELGYEGVSNHCLSAVSGSPDHRLLPMALIPEHFQVSDVNPSPPLMILQVIFIQIKVHAVHVIVFLALNSAQEYLSGCIYFPYCNTKQAKTTPAN
jgi:hypothetical protein